MKKEILLAILLLATIQLFAQRSSIKEDTIEVRGKRNTYIKLDDGLRYRLENKIPVLQRPQYNYPEIPKEENGREVMVNFGDASDLRRTYDVNVVDNLVKKYLVPEIKKTPSKINEGSLVYITFRFDLDGILKEIIMSYPVWFDLPINVYEQFEKALLNSGLQLTYDKNHYTLRYTVWLDAVRAYTVKRLLAL